jgi:hypothetical protein
MLKAQANATPTGTDTGTDKGETKNEENETLKFSEDCSCKNI